MIYYSTQPVDLTAVPASQGIDDAIQRGLKALSEEAGQAVILTDVIPVTLSGSTVCLIIIAKPYEPEKQQRGIEGLLRQAMKIEEGRGIIEKIGEILLREAGKIEGETKV